MLSLSRSETCTRYCVCVPPNTDADLTTEALITDRVKAHPTLRMVDNPSLMLIVISSEGESEKDDCEGEGEFIKAGHVILLSVVTVSWGE